jgi:hypothetical protein
VGQGSDPGARRDARTREDTEHDPERREPSERWVIGAWSPLFAIVHAT